MRTLKILSFVLLAACLASGADQAGLTGPVSGLLFDARTKAVRPMVGVPGGSYLGDALASGFDLAAVSPAGRLVLGVEQGRVVVLDLAANRSRALEGALAGASRIAWVDDSTAALASAGQVQLWRDLSGAAELAAVGDLDGQVVALTASSKSVVAATATGVYLLGPDGPARLLAAVGNASALAISGGDLYVADRARGEIAVVRDFESGSGAESFVRFDDPAGLAVQNGLLFAAGGTSRTLAAFRVAGSAPAGEIALEFEPTRVERLSGSLFLLNRAGENEPLYVLDAAQGLAVYFVPSEAASITEE